MQIHKVRLRKSASYFHIIVIAVYLGYAMIMFRDGSVKPCSETTFCAKVPEKQTIDFDKNLCLTENFCANKSGRVRSATEYEAYKTWKSFFWVIVGSIGLRIVIAQANRNGDKKRA